MEPHLDWRECNLTASTTCHGHPYTSCDSLNGVRGFCRFIWPVGFIVSVVGVGRVFNSCSAAGKTKLVLAMTSVSTIAMFLIGLIMSTQNTDGDERYSMSTRLPIVVLVFVVAVGVGLPYYVPSGEFAVNFGEEQAGVVSAYLDGASALATGSFLKVLSVLVRDPVHLFTSKTL